MYVLSEENPKLGSHVHWLERNGDYDFQLSMSDMFSNALTDIEENEGRIIDALGFVDTTYINPRPDLLMSCLSSLFMLNYSSVFPAYVDNGNFWLENHTGFEEISNSLKRRDEKPKVYRACYGLGTFFKASVIRCKLALKENNGVIPFYEMEHALRDRTSE